MKGLSIEHEKLAVVQGQHSSSLGHDSQLDSPTGRKQSKINSISNSGTKETLEGGSGDQLLQQHHASTSSSSYSPVMSPYMHPPHYRPAYEQRVPASAPPPSHYEANPRKKHHRSSSDTMQDAAAAAAVRASVLRDGRDGKSRPPSESEKHSPISLAYRPSVSQPQQPQEPEPKSDDKGYPQSSSSSQHLMRYEGGPDANNAAVNAAASAAAAVTFDRTAAVDVDGNSKPTPESRRSSVDPGSSCPEGKRNLYFSSVFSGCLGHESHEKVMKLNRWS